MPGWRDSNESDLAKSLSGDKSSNRKMLELEQADEANPLEGLDFKFGLRKYQLEILELMKIKLERGERQLHIVAPPGAGKTIIGLQIACQLKEPTLIISPTTTIQSQWAEKLSLFLPPDLEPFGASHLLGTHEDRPLKPITLLTYQVLSTPGREQEYLETLARQQWIKELMAGGQSQGDAEIRLLDLLRNNKKAFDREMSRHIGRLRKKLTEVLDLKEVLHKNALDLIQALRRQKFKVVIFDECHHLTDYWAAIMLQIVKRLNDPIVIGLTGTPPEGKSQGQERRYLSLVGDIDYQVPTPALVREGGLAPFQDLVLFTRPTPEEEKFLSEQHADFHELIEELSAGENSPLDAWVLERMSKACESSWAEFASGKPQLAAAFCRYAWSNRLNFAEDIELSIMLMQSPFIEDWMAIFEDFTLQKLKVSPETKDHALYERIRKAVAKLGYGITERGLRKQASPVDRVLAFSKNKARAVAEILDIEYRNLEDRLRAVIVTDFERMSATAGRRIEGVLTSESGGAIAVLKEVLAAPVSALVNPCLVTGSLIYVDRAVAQQFLQAMNELLAEAGEPVTARLADNPAEQYVEITSDSSGWESRLYVGLATRILERGITKVLIGTRGIFGEGWDCQALNTLVDLTTTTTPMSVKQLRGRSIRINTADPLGARKVANNWDVVCIAPHLEKGLNDYERFARKHHGYFGICDDGQIECGVSHVHAAFSELTAAEVFASSEDLNEEMKMRALARDAIYTLWKVGEPYRNKTLGCLELARLRTPNLTPPNIKYDLLYSEHAGMMRANLNGVWLEYGLFGAAGAGAAFLLLAQLLPAVALAAILPAMAAAFLARKKYLSLYDRLKSEMCKIPSQETAVRDMAQALLVALIQAKLISESVAKERIIITRRSDGSHRVFLDEVDPQQSQYFTKSLKELLTPISNQPFLIPKYEYCLGDLAEDKKENSIDRFFKNYLKGRAQTNLVAYYPVPSLLARSTAGREAFESAWNKYVSPGDLVSTEEKPELLRRYFGLGPDVSQRLLWE